jgi:hypothetical protein
MNFRITISASSRVVGRSLFSDATSSITMPMLPTRSAARTVKTGAHSPLGVRK